MLALPLRLFCGSGGWSAPPAPLSSPRLRAAPALKLGALPGGPSGPGIDQVIYGCVRAEAVGIDNGMLVLFPGNTSGENQRD